MKKITIGVMGPGETASQKDIDFAYEVGKLIAGNNWTTLTGGMKLGVMHAAVSGAKDNGGGNNWNFTSSWYGRIGQIRYTNYDRFRQFTKFN